MMEYVGWIGSILLALCGLPEAISCVIKKKCQVPWTLIAPWYAGEWLVCIYTFYKLGWNPLMVNYIFNIILISIMIYYKRGKND